MTIKFIFHFPSLELVNEAIINAVSPADKPIIILRGFEGKHTQIIIEPFNDENTSKQALPFTDRVQYYRKSLRPFIKLKTVPWFVTELQANALVFGAIVGGLDLSGALADFLSGLANPVTTGYEGNYIGFFDGNSVDLEGNVPTSLSEFTEGLAGN